MMDATPQPPTTNPTISDQKRLVALLLCFFLGMLGVHRFYVGKVGTGILQVVTFGGLTFWVFIDFIIILVGAFKDKQGRTLQAWT
jgi:TM2 domain-containing membrane protein YozV